MKEIFFFIFTLFSFSHLLANDLSWSSPYTLSGPMVSVSDPQIVLDPSGNATAVWVEDGYIKASFQPVGESWGSVSTISGGGASFPRIGVDSSGNVTAVWEEGDAINTASLPINGSWSSAVTLSDTGASSPILAIRSNGDMAAVWVRSGFIEASTKVYGGAWSLVSLLSASNSDNPTIAIGENGTVCAVWHSVVLGNHVVLSATQMIGGAWGSPKTILTGGYSFNYPNVAVDNNGNSTVVFFRYTLAGSNYVDVGVVASSLPYNASGWEIFPTLLTPKSGSRDPAGLKAKIAFDGSGNAIALWSNSYDGHTFTIEASIKPKGGTWTQSGELTLADFYAFEADVSTNSSGAALVAYMEYDGSSVIVQASESGILGILPYPYFSPSVALSNGNNNGYSRISSSLVGDTLYAVAIWLSSDGFTTSIQTSNGSKVTISPPSNLSVSQSATSYGVFTDYANTISWDASTSVDVTEYAIFRNGVLIDRVDSSTLEYIDHNAQQNGEVTYGICAIDATFSQSTIANISYP